MRNEAKLILSRIEQQLGDSSRVKTVIHNAIKQEGRIEDLEQADLTKELDGSSHEEQEPLQPPATFRDARVCSMEFKNFRTFPGETYGITFGKRNSQALIPRSVFLVGGNGTGKSTISSALEYAYTGNVALVDGLKDVNRDDYLTYGFGRTDVKKEDVGLTLKSMDPLIDRVIKLSEPVDPYCTIACFCSELDVEKLTTSKEDDIGEFLLEQLGYGELLVLKEKLRDFVITIKNSKKKAEDQLGNDGFTESDYNLIINDYLSSHYQKGKREQIAKLSEEDTFNELINNIKVMVLSEDKPSVESVRKNVDSIPENIFKEKWDELINTIIMAKKDASGLVSSVQGIEVENQQKENSKGRAEERLAAKLYQLHKRLNQALVNEGNGKSGEDGIEGLFKDLQDLYKGLGTKEFIETQEQLQEFSDAFDEIAKKIEKELGNVIDEFLRIDKEFIEKTMNAFSPDTEVFNIEKIVNWHLKPQIKVKEKDKEFSCNPKEYYNTFRFKLYVVALKISLAFLYMRSQKIVVPIVIDDVFNANDFENSVKLERFVYSIYRTYDEQVGTDIPMQLILLTHDEMVLTSFRKGAKLLQEQEWTTGSPYKNDRDFICARLFPYSQAKEIKNLPYLQAKEIKKLFYPEAFDNLYLEI